MTPGQGEVWWSEVEGKRRPVLIVSRDRVIPILNRLTVAPVTTNVRGIATEIPLGPEEGLPRECAAAFDNLQLQYKPYLTEQIGQLRNAGTRICAALSALADC